MLEFKASAFVATTSMLRAVSTMSEVRTDPDKQIDGDIKALIKRDIEKLIDHIKPLHLPMVDKSAGRLVKAVDYEWFTYRNFSEYYQEIESRIKDELELRLVVCLDPERGRLYSSDEPLFGTDVATKYQSAAYEIDEAAKCLALGRYTATVFHLMRAMEVALKAVAKCLNIPDPVKSADRNWGKILEKVEEATENRNKGKPPWSDPKDRAFFDDVRASLDVIRVAWRNATMHIENKYTEDEADHIYRAVRTFMRKLAFRMDEDGNPKA